jgi:hypothetical protein
MPFCVKCGTAMADTATGCGRCGFPAPINSVRPQAEFSDKSFGAAVALCGIFGTVGLHHFYLGNIVHGVFDLGLFVGSIVCFFSGDPSLQMLGLILILMDALHTLFVFYKLIVGQQLDGAGRLVTYPGQFRS